MIGLYSAFRPSNPRLGKIVLSQTQCLDHTNAVITAPNISEEQRQADERRAQEAIARAQYERQRVSLPKSADVQRYLLIAAHASQCQK